MTVENQRWGEGHGQILSLRMHQMVTVDEPIGAYHRTTVLVACSRFDDRPMIRASYTTDLAGEDNDLTFISQLEGEDGLDITIEYVDPEENDESLGIVVVAEAITVNLATDGSGEITSTAEDIRDAILGDADALALVVPLLAEGSNGTGVVTEMGEQLLHGGLDAEDAEYTLILQALNDAGDVLREWEGPIEGTGIGVMDLPAVANASQYRMGGAPGGLVDGYVIVIGYAPRYRVVTADQQWFEFGYD